MEYQVKDIKFQQPTILTSHLNKNKNVKLPTKMYAGDPVIKWGSSKKSLWTHNVPSRTVPILIWTEMLLRSKTLQGTKAELYMSCMRTFADCACLRFTALRWPLNVSCFLVGGTFWPRWPSLVIAHSQHLFSCIVPQCADPSVHSTVSYYLHPHATQVYDDLGWLEH